MTAFGMYPVDEVIERRIDRNTGTPNPCVRHKAAHGRRSKRR